MTSNTPKTTTTTTTTTIIATTPPAFVWKSSPHRGHAYWHQRSSSPEWIESSPSLVISSAKQKNMLPAKALESKASPLLSPAQAQMKQDALAQARTLYEHYQKTKPTIADTVRPTVFTDPSQVSHMMRHQDIDTVLFDCDGVIYRHMDPCPGAAETIRSLINTKKVLFVSNNGAVSRQQLRDKLVKVLNLPQIQVEQCISSAYSTAKYLQGQLLSNDSSTTSRRNPPRVHMIGTDGLKKQLEHHGFGVHRLEDDDAPSSHESRMTHAQVQDHTFPTEPFDAVVIGHDTDFHFRKIVTATNILAKNPKALLVATDLDSHDVVGSQNNHMPGNGPLVRCIEASSGRTAVDCGKPGRTLAKLLQQEYDLPDLARCLFVGDRLSSDIAFANRNGMKSLLVLTGVTTAQTLMKDLPPKGTERDPLPHYICPFIGYLNPTTDTRMSMIQIRDQ